jgi:thioester reductase-like protein
MNLYLTGATGFVGRNFLLEALRVGRYEKIFLPVRDVVKLKRQLEMEAFGELPANVVPLNAGEDFEVPREKIDEAVHCAGI